MYFQGTTGYDFRRNMKVSLDSNGTYNTDLFTEEAEIIIREHDASKPLFLYMAQAATHAPLQAPQELVDRFGYISANKRKTFAGNFVIYFNSFCSYWSKAASRSIVLVLFNLLPYRLIIQPHVRHYFLYPSGDTGPHNRGFPSHTILGQAFFIHDPSSFFISFLIIFLNVILGPPGFLFPCCRLMFVSFSTSVTNPTILSPLDGLFYCFSKHLL